MVQIAHRKKETFANAPEDCIFCKIATDPHERDKFYNKPLLESQNFFVIPALGHFVEGYTLLVTKKHYLNFARLENELFHEMIGLKQKISTILSRVYEKPVFFEHGPISRTLTGGCCIDHAHLHIVPKNIDVSGKLNSHFESFVVNPNSLLSSQISSEFPYLYFENGKAHVFKVDVLPRQYLRQIIANELNCLQYWDWRRFPFYDKTSDFLRRIHKSMECTS